METIFPQTFPHLLVNLNVNLMTVPLPRPNQIWGGQLPILSKSNVCIRHWYLTKSVGSFHSHSGWAPPLQNHWDLYNTIDSTPLGDTPWESFSLCFNGYQPEGQDSSWMDTDYDFWICNTHQLVHNIISNLDFKDGFDYTPYQEHDINRSCHYHNLMSENWAWWQAVHSNKTSLSACTSCA